jgi:uncharacterized OsmC-like protein
VQIAAFIRSGNGSHEVSVRTGDSSRRVAVPGKSAGRGSAVSGGEFLMLALATCFCNDVYREAERLRVPIDGVEVEARAEFDGVGVAATNVVYRARVASSAPAETIARLLRETDAVTEVQNTLRRGVGVALAPWGS